MGGRFFKYCGAFALGILAACADTPRPTPVPKAEFAKPRLSDLESIWQNATVAIPVRGTSGSMLTTNSGRAGPPLGLAGVGPDVRWPIILVLQGCHRAVPVDLLKSLAEQGYVAFAPASEARRNNPLNCAENGSLQRDARSTFDQRRTELSFVLGKILSESWTDKRNIFVIGLYDAAAAVARYTGDGINGRVLADWNCQGTGGHAGVAAEEKSPVFAVTSASVSVVGGDCGQYLKAGQGSEVVSFPARYSSNLLLEPVIFTRLMLFFDRQIFK
ncbi:MAG: hypothetical protein MI743_10710 [Sneathiellales bacterium]|nr:hypothetical protein [Sneathiellales bacterium]